MSNPEYDKTPDQLMANAEGGFDISHAFVPPDANHLRIGAAGMFAEGAGELLYDRLMAQGLTDREIDELADSGLLGAKLQELAPAELHSIRQSVQRIVASDPRARNALQDEVYFTDREQGRTQND